MDFPGLPIHSSHDLKTWTLISNALHRPDQLPGLGDVNAQTGGIWAPTIRFHDSTFYITTALVYDSRASNDSSRWDNVIFTSKNPYDADSWTLPIHFKFDGYDTSPFWDDDGTTYVVGASLWTSRPGIHLASINLEIGDVGPQATLWNGTGGIAPEGLHLYKKDGWYFLLIAEGGTFTRHMVTVARSRSISGPYDSFPGNPILSNANTKEYFQAVGHADLFQDWLGRWWGVAHAMRLTAEPLAVPMGRETSLYPVTWDDGSWPVLEPVRSVMSGRELPASNDGTDVTSLDEVDFAPGATLPLHFVHWRLPDANSFSVSPEERPHSLRLMPSKLNLTAYDGLSAPGGQSFIARRQVHTLFTFSVDISFSPQKLEEEAGFSVFTDQGAHIDLGIVLLARNDSGDDTPSSTSRCFRLRAESKRGSLETIVVVPQTWMDESSQLEIKAANLTHYTFSAAPAVHKSQSITIGWAEEKLVTPMFTGALVEVYATTNGADVEPTFAYVGQWRYQGQGQYID